MENRNNNSRVAVCVFPNNILGTICRRIILNNDFISKGRFLAKNAVKRLSNELCMIVGKAHYRDQRHVKVTGALLFTSHY